MRRGGEGKAREELARMQKRSSYRGSEEQVEGGKKIHGPSNCPELKLRRENESREGSESRARSYTSTGMDERKNPVGSSWGPRREGTSTIYRLRGWSIAENFGTGRHGATPALWNDPS